MTTLMPPRPGQPQPKPRPAPRPAPPPPPKTTAAHSDDGGGLYNPDGYGCGKQLLAAVVIAPIGGAAIGLAAADHTHWAVAVLMGGLAALVAFTGALVMSGRLLTQIALGALLCAGLAAALDFGQPPAPPAHGHTFRPATADEQAAHRAQQLVDQLEATRADEAAR